VNTKPLSSTPALFSRALLALVVVSAVAIAGCAKKEAPAAAAPEVYVAEAIQRDVPVFMEVVGQTKGFQDVEIRARVEGYLDRVAFTEGAFVRKGDLLYQIDPKPFEAALAGERAQLATWEARLQKADNDVARFRPLVEKQAVSRMELDNALAAQEAARAQVDAQKAQVENAKLNLGYTHITSPLDGLVGTTRVKAGNLVGRGESTLLTTISQLDPMLFRAGISEAEMLRLAKRANELGAAKGESPVPIELLLADGTVHDHPGRLDSVDRAVDPTTGTLAVQFTFPNPERLLRPGQYGRARFQVETKKGALLIPQRAVQELQNLYTVAVVGTDEKVSIRTVKVGPRVDNLWVIEDGLEPGEKVVVEGLQRVREGAVVRATPAEPAAAPGQGK